MISQNEFDQFLISSVSLGLEKCLSSERNDKLTGYGLVFDESFVSMRIAATRRSISGDNFNLDNWESGVSLTEVTDRDYLKELYEQCQDYDNDDSWHEEFQSRVYLSGITALENLSNLSKLSLRGTFLSVWVSDSNINTNKAKSCIKRLNNRDQYESFVAYMDEIA